MHESTDVISSTYDSCSSFNSCPAMNFLPGLGAFLPLGTLLQNKPFSKKTPSKREGRHGNMPAFRASLRLDY